MSYFNEGKQLEKRRNIEEAVEKYIDAIYDEKLKGIATPVSQQSLDAIDQLTKNM